MVSNITSVSRVATAFENFWRGVQPVEPDTGTVCDSGRRICPSRIFVTVELSVPVSVKSALGQNASPDSRSGLVLNDFLGRNILSSLL